VLHWPQDLEVSAMSRFRMDVHLHFQRVELSVDALTNGMIGLQVESI
jgi:hypothetical protein